jgi:predicted short-subunit dehydrogenase-like oxidoreductase (DUF2520 family)
VGRLGTALAIALDRKGYPIEALVAAHMRSVKKAAARLDARPLVLVAKDLGSLGSYDPTELIIIATPDDQIEPVVSQLKDLGPKENRVAIHTSGALSSKVLSPLNSNGWHVGSLHPLVSVSDPIAGAEALAGAFWCVEGDLPASRLAREIVAALGGQSFSIKPEQKSLYHAAAVMSSGNIVALFDIALEMLRHCGLSRKDARAILLPLIESTVANLTRSDPAVALTGTFVRADEATVARHLDVLSDKQLATASELYRLLGRRSVELALSRGVNEQALNRILKKLKSSN